MTLMKKLLILLLAAGLFLLAGCESGGDTMEGENTFTQIDQETAKEMMARDDGHVARLVHAEVDLAALRLLDGGRRIVGDRAGLCALDEHRAADDGFTGWIGNRSPDGLGALCQHDDGSHECGCRRQDGFAECFKHSGFLVMVSGYGCGYLHKDGKNPAKPNPILSVNSPISSKNANWTNSNADVWLFSGKTLI